MAKNPKRKKKGTKVASDGGNKSNQEFSLDQQDLPVSAAQEEQPQQQQFHQLLPIGEDELFEDEEELMPPPTQLRRITSTGSAVGPPTTQFNHHHPMGLSTQFSFMSSSLTRPSDTLNGSVHARDGRKTYDFLLDDPSQMTYGRRMALSMMKYNWYYPKPENSTNDDMRSSHSRSPDDLDVSSSSNVSTGRRMPRLGGSTSTYHNASSNDTLDDKNGLGVSGGLGRNFRSGATGSFGFARKGRRVIGKPSLAKAWAYFEHVTLPRFLFIPKDPNKPRKSLWRRIFRRLFLKGGEQLDRADPGELHRATRLYSPLFTPMSQMGDFGLGTGLYFATMRAMMVITFILGLINIPNIVYFNSMEYSDGQEGVPVLLKGSAICTRTTWVPCPTCSLDNQFNDNPDRLANITLPSSDGGTTTNVTYVFAMRNLCDGTTFQLARYNFATIVFLLIGLAALQAYQRKWEDHFDEDEDTARDYSVVVKNPPPDARDPDEWKDYFEKNFQVKVAVVTIGIDNDLLVQALVQRRQVLRQLELEVDPDFVMDVLSLARLATSMERKRSAPERFLRLFLPGVPEFFGRLTVLTSKVQGLAQQEYAVRNVFVTFEKERHRLRVLNAFRFGALTHWGVVNLADEDERFYHRGKLLAVRRPDEPATIRWQDLNSKFRTRLLQMIMTNTISIGIMALIAYLIAITYDRLNELFGAVAIALANLAFPQLAKQLTDLEAHFSEGDKQTSLYFKVALFRWVNTAVVITIIMPFTATLQNESGLIRAVYNIFFAELFTTNVIRLADPMGNIRRHILAPRANTQDAMNLQMGGSEVELAERMTDMTKIIFLAFWYTALFPGGLFFCSFVLLVKYFTDRFGLMRTWKRVPPLGNRISRFSSRYFVSTAVIAMALIASHNYAGYPFDNLCENTGSVDDSYVGDWQLTTSGNARIVFASVTRDDASYRYCLQSLGLSIRTFPAIPQNQPEGQEWMDAEQADVVTVTGWTSVVTIAFVVCCLLWLWFSNLLSALFHSKEHTISMGAAPFHKVLREGSISTYIPQVESKLFSYPLLACNTKEIDEEIYDWTDPDRTFGSYDLSKDAEFLCQGIGLDVRHSFSSVRHYKMSRLSSGSTNSDNSGFRP